MTARVALPSRRSEATGLPRTSSEAVRSRTSSTIWKARPRLRPYSPSCVFDLVGSAEAVGRSDGCTELHGDLEEAGGLAEDQVEVLFFVDEVTELLHLQEFAFDHLLGEGDEQFEDAEVALFEGGGEGLHVEPVAGEDAFGVAPGGVGGGAAAAGVGLVDDVVVDEGGGVEHLDDGAEADAALAGAAEGFGGEQEQQRTDALAAAGHEVAGDVGDDFDLVRRTGVRTRARWRRGRRGEGRRPLLRSRWRSVLTCQQE